MNILICSKCSKAIRKNQNGIYCNNSNQWLHVKCTNLTNEEFKLLCKQDDDIPWCCNHCILDVLPFRNVTNSEFLEQHQFCSKKNLTFQLDPNELNELFVDDSIQLSNVSDIDYHDFFDISYYFSENSKNIIANMQTQSSSFLITMHLNIRSLPANFDKLQSLLANMKLKPHILSINETWLNNNQKGEFNNLSNYVFISNNRIHSRGGGVALYVDDTLSFSVRDNISIMKEKICETLFIDVHFNKQETVTIGTIYRSPLNNNISHSNFADSLTSLLKTVKSSKNHTIIMGDFNYNLLEFDNPHVNDFVQIMYEHKFYPMINKPTRITTNSATLIGHIWTNISHCTIFNGILVDCIADHLPILQSVQLKSPPVKNTKTGKRHISSFNISKFVKKLEIYNFSGIFAFTDVNSAYEKFIQQFCTIFDECFPITPTISKKKRGKPWYDTPVTGMKYSPAQILFSRRLRTKIPVATSLLSPVVVDPSFDLIRNQARQKYYYDRQGVKPLSSLQRGDVVCYRKNNVWQKSDVVKDCNKPRSYMIRRPNDCGVLRRNRRHLYKANLKRPEYNRPFCNYSRASQQVSSTATPVYNASPLDSTLPDPSSGSSVSTSRYGRPIKFPSKYSDFVV